MSTRTTHKLRMHGLSELDISALQHRVTALEAGLEHAMQLLRNFDNREYDHSMLHERERKDRRTS